MTNDMQPWNSKGTHKGRCKACRREAKLDTHYLFCHKCYDLANHTKKYPKIKGLHHKDTYGIFSGKIWLSNKFDGSCARIKITEDGFLLGSKGRVFDKRPYHKDHPTEDKIWWRLWDYIQDKYDNERIRDLSGYVIFGEACGKGNTHKINYPFALKFIVFDVWDEIQERFLEPSEWMPIIHESGLDFVKHEKMDCDYDIIKHLISDFDVVKDCFEGYVIKNFKCPHTYTPGGRLYGKIYHPDAKEKESKIFGSPKEEKTYPLEHKLLGDWVTIRRVTGCLHQGWDDGQPGHGLEVMAWLPKRWDDGQPGHGLEVMAWLPKMVWEDVVNEEFANWILTQRHKDGILHLDLRFIRKRLNKMVINILREYLIELAKGEETSK